MVTSDPAPASGDLDEALDARSRGFLDWPELLARLAAEARSERGRAACAALSLYDSADEARAALEEVAEVARLLRAGHALPGLAFPDAEPFLDAAERSMTLGPDELRPVAELGEVAGSVARFFARSAGGGEDSRIATGAPAELAPRIAAMLAELDPCRPLVTRIRETFDSSGAVRDSVSPELARLRREREALSAHVRSEIENLMQSEDYASVLQDRFWTVREDRYVLPLRASAKSMGLGIVHDTSRTGETVFVEPTVVVGLNNRLKLAELQIEREIRRILEELTGDVARAAPALRVNLDLLATFDVIAAKARLGVGYRGEALEITDEPLITLRAARHPLLTLRAAREGFRVVDNDVTLDGQPAKVLVISGPNAGGKTVLLKTLGLAALLARAGMLVPADAGGRVGFFTAVLADIGDQQSVLGDLSTFSAHLANLSAILRHEAGGGAALVLLDEIMAGTNPDQGAALARATAEALAERAGLAVITTHYDALKALAEADARFRNAGMEYDLVNLRPTFRLKDGVPGRSYALDIAARIGLPDEILLRARSLMNESSLGLEETLRNLQTREQALERAGQDLEQTRLELEDAKQELEVRTDAEKTATEALTRRERDLAMRSREAIDAAVRDAREAISEIVREVRRERSPQAAEVARVALDKKAKEVTAKLPEPPALDLNRLREALANRGLGTGKKDDKAKKKPVSQAQRAEGPAAGPVLVLQSRANSLDLRGRRADEALAELEAFLDRTALEGADTVFVIHGHGTGALRKVVREYLATSPYVARFRAGGAGEGGDGVSVVSLKG